MKADELAKGRALREREQASPFSRPTTYAFSDWLDQHADELLADAEAQAEQCQAVIDGWRELYNEQFNKRADVETDLDLVAMGIKHYDRCPNHFAGPSAGLACQRCQRETAEQQIAELVDVLVDVVDQACADGTDNQFDSRALTAYADGLRLLAKFGRVEITAEYGRRVIARLCPREGTWTPS